MRRGPFAIPLLPALAVLFVAVAGPSCAAPPEVDPREVHLADLVQLTDGGENAEAYWSPDGSQLIFQSLRPPFSCDQIFRMRADGSGKPIQVSTGKGRTTCSYFLAGGDRVIYSSTHAAGPECPPVPDRSQGYVWPIYDSYEIWSARPDGSDLKRLTENRAYDAEATVCPKDGAVVFTSTRDGDLELYRMDPDGGNVRRLTSTPGYDGGAFFSPDCSKLVWRASRPAPGSPELKDYRDLLARGLVRPGKLEIWVADAGGGNARQVTSLGAASFAPSFFPSGDRIVFSSNYGDDKGREFDLWAVDLDGSRLERLTWTPGFDGFPLFSPDGTRLAFSSNRNQAKPGETNVFVARWLDRPKTGNKAAAIGDKSAAAKRFLADVSWLADDARGGRGLGTPGLEESARWLAERFREIGLEPAGQPDGGKPGYFHEVAVPVAVEAEPGTRVVVDGRALPREHFRPVGFSSEGTVEGEVVAAGYGITAPELGVDDYHGVDAKGKIAVVRRFTPGGKPFDDPDVESRYGDIRLKAWNAREHGARALLVVDLPASGAPPGEALLPELQVSTSGDAGIPVLVLAREAGQVLFQEPKEGEAHRAHRAEIAVDLAVRTAQARNVVGVLRAGAADRLPGAVLLGAHYDHLGLGGRSSLAPGVQEVHNGADDNASGTAALLEAARALVPRRGELRRDVYLAAFSAEEVGVVGSSALVRHPPEGLRPADLTAMINMDMVGRLRDDKLLLLGRDSAAEWPQVVDPACQAAGLECTLAGEGFGPSDHMPFYTAGVPVLHLFTGIHDDYHRPSDDADKIDAEGGARIASLAADLLAAVANRPHPLTYKEAKAPAPSEGDVRTGGASLGTVPDYAGDGRPGVLIADVRPGGAAEKAGMRHGDLLVELAGAPVRDIYDFTYALRKAKPGEKSTAVVMRGEERLTLEVTFGAAPQAR
jgi:Peptidase family M28/PA domain/PDZ domain/WD40-like Beta Propeller Repeat